MDETPMRVLAWVLVIVILVLLVIFLANRLAL